jgi:hypothetical protein
MKGKTFAILIYLVFLLILLELFSGVLLSTKYGMRFVQKIDCDVSRRLLWLKRHMDTHSGFYYKFDIYNYTKGWSIKPNLMDMPVFKGKVLSSNSKGIRGKREYQYGKSIKKRILILGDSFTFGEEVSDNETYSYYLQQALPSSEVINFGVHGYGHDQMLIYFKEEGIKYEPDIVILGFVGSNMKRNILEFRDYSKPKFRVLNGKLKLENSRIMEPGEFIKKKPYDSKFVDLLNLIYQGYRNKRRLSQIEAEKVTTAILDEMVNIANLINAVPVFIYLPTNDEMSAFNKKLPQEEYLSRYCMNRGIYFLSLKSYFLAKRNIGVVTKAKGHWEAKEHQIAAEAIKKYLENKNIITKTD